MRVFSLCSCGVCVCVCVHFLRVKWHELFECEYINVYERLPRTVPHAHKSSSESNESVIYLAFLPLWIYSSARVTVTYSFIHPSLLYNTIKVHISHIFRSNVLFKWARISVCRWAEWMGYLWEYSHTSHSSIHHESVFFMVNSWKYHSTEANELPKKNIFIPEFYLFIGRIISISFWNISKWKFST